MAAHDGDDGSELGGVPASPPPHVLSDVAFAAAWAEALWRSGRELHFAVDERTGKVSVELRDLAGREIRTLLPSEALDLLSGWPP